MRSAPIVHARQQLLEFIGRLGKHSGIISVNQQAHAQVRCCVQCWASQGQALRDMVLQAVNVDAKEGGGQWAALLDSHRRIDGI